METETDLIKRLRTDFNLNIDALTETVKKYSKTSNEDKIRDAFTFAAQAHDGQMRKDNCSPYIIHPFETAQILASLHADETTIIAALLHDVPEDTATTIEEIEQNFGPKVAFLVEGITKLSKVHFRNDMKERQIESLKKLFIHMAEDPRTILIKLADRLHNMRTLKFIENQEKKKRIARETLEIFVPIANLLGIAEIKDELEDLCFRYLHPQEFKLLSQEVKQMREHTSDVSKANIRMVEKKLKEAKITGVVIMQQKNLYSTYKRITSHHKPISELEDYISLKVLVSEKAQCYEVLGVIHSIFKPKLKDFRDYIAVPKVNGYQCLHTTVFSLQGIPAEFQIMTNQMHCEAQYGIASHYFNEGPQIHLGKDKRSHWFEEMLKSSSQEIIKDHFLNELKQDLLQDRIYVFTPVGDLIDLPEAATCIDFAYHIHTQVGHRATKAELNGEIVPLNHLLQMGDTVKIILSEQSKGPSYEWLSFAKTSQAKNKIKDYYKKENSISKIQFGRKILQKEYDRAGLGFITNLSSWKIRKVSNQFPEIKIENLDDIFINIAEGILSPLEFINTLFHRNRLAKDSPVNSAAPTQNSENIKKLLREKMVVKIGVKLVCSPTVDLIKVLETPREMGLNQIYSKAKYSVMSGHIICRATVLVSNFEDVSRLFERLEQVEGVKKVSRTFLRRKIYFLLGGFVTFVAWAMHPFILSYFNEIWLISNPNNIILSNIVLYSGLLMLFALIFSLKYLTQRSFPELRETNILWGTAYLLSLFALATIAAEVYILNLQFNWLFVFAVFASIISYLTWQYIKFRGNR